MPMPPSLRSKADVTAKPSVQWVGVESNHSARFRREDRRSFSPPWLTGIEPDTLAQRDAPNRTGLR